MPAETTIPSQAPLSSLFPLYLPDEDQCKQKAHTEDEVPAMREKGQFAPVVLAQSRGSFSDPGRKEVAYLVALHECSDDSAWQTREVIVVPDAGRATPIARAEVSDDRLLDAFDLTQDGQTELFLAGDSSVNGVFAQHAEIYQFDKGKLRKLEDFGTVYENYCRSALSAQGLSAVVIEYIPRTEKEKLPRFFALLFRAVCPPPNASPAWQLVSPK